MKQKTQKLRVAYLMCLFITSIYAQQTVTTTGGNASGSGGTLNYSVGQVFYTSNNGSQGTMTQGVQQSYLISIILGSEDSMVNIYLTAYPNPTNDFLNLKVNHYKTENLTYQLFDITGKLLENKKLDGNETRIDMMNFPQATYILTVTENNKRIKTFQIIKTDSL